MDEEDYGIDLKRYERQLSGQKKLKRTLSIRETSSFQYLGGGVESHQSSNSPAVDPEKNPDLLPSKIVNLPELIKDWPLDVRYGGNRLDHFAPMVAKWITRW